MGEGLRLNRLSVFDALLAKNYMRMLTERILVTYVGRCSVP